MPVVRPRRLREKDSVREWIAGTRLHPRDFILPYFVVAGKNIKREINSLPGVYHLSLDNLLKDIAKAAGIKSILLFGVSEVKDDRGRQAARKNGIVQKAVKVVKEQYKDLIVITDVCLCGYTSSGHCGLVNFKKPVAGNQKPELEVDNDNSLRILTQIALSHAEAGADFIAPSAMMDGQVGAIRNILDRKGFTNVGILAYSAKYASGFYGPFREALASAPQVGDRKSYQLDYRNSGQALREIKLDIDEGADIVMVKPALAYLDIIYRVKQKFNLPLAAYNVSGEYAMIKKLAGGDRETERNLALEVLTSIKRAGADLIISYFAKEIGKWLD